MSRVRCNGAKRMNPPQPLWLALHLPRLPLEVHAPASPPSAVVENGRILVCDEAAQAAGIESGMGTAAARMLAPAVALLARNAAREAAVLHALACWAGTFTSRLSLVADGLLLEVGGSLRLFGGLERLAETARTGLQAQGFRIAPAAAPTPQGALWLARSSTAALCGDEHVMRDRLERLPITVFPAPTAAALSRFGARTLADVRRLPAAALARRIGADAPQMLARAFGESPDPRADFVFPERFAASLELPVPVENAAALLFAARRLTAALAGWLAARQAGVRELLLQLRHRGEETRLALRFADLAADGGRFERVLRERLERLSLRAPVETLALEATDVAPRPGRNASLFRDAHAEQDAVGGLLERLRARLGEARVFRLATRDDHRPECASRHADLFAHPAPNDADAAPRPLWLLERPEVLREVDGRPWRNGHLKLLAGPERIESGWWDGGEAIGDLRRDYFVALAADGGWLWIYRECRAPGGWFLHGFFS